jgi:hypothetical protein
VPGVVDQNVSRDIILLESLRNGLDLAASATFAPAFGGSTDLNTYRWGKLHRVVLAHPLGGQLNIRPREHRHPSIRSARLFRGSRVPADANPWMRPRTMPARTA